MKTAKAHRKFAIYSNFLDTILEGEEEIQEGETRKEVMKRILAELEETASELRMEYQAKCNGVPLPNYKPYMQTDVWAGADLSSRQPLPVIDYGKMEHD